MKYKPYKGTTLFITTNLIESYYFKTMGLLSMISLAIIIRWATKGGGK